ncbi:ABC transporter permease [soil metagenome]
MRSALRAELFKQRSTRTWLSLFGAMLGLVLFAVLLHGSLLGDEQVDSASEQLTVVFGWGEFLGALIAALLGAMSITGEIRHGTIRPTFLITPDRGRVVSAKVWASMLIGIGFGLAAGAVAIAVGIAALRSREIDVWVDASDIANLLVGGAVAAALWAAIGVGVGAVVRDQTTALVGICAWLLFVENLLVGDLAGGAGRFLPGALGRAISGQDAETLMGPWVSLVLLALYAAAAAIVGRMATVRRDFS